MALPTENSNSKSNPMALLVTQHLQGRNKYAPFVVALLVVFLLPVRIMLRSKSFGDSALDGSRIDNSIVCDSFPEGIFQFMNALSRDPEKNALRPWTLDGRPKFVEWRYPGFSSKLLHSAFRKKRVTLFGDSSLHFMMRWLQKLSQTSDEDIDKLQSMDLSEANEWLNPDALHHVGFFEDSKSGVQFNDGTHIYWAGYRGGDVGEDACQFDELWEKIARHKPDVLVANFGLHWLHLINGGRDVPLCYVQWWLDYEKWLEQVVKVADSIGTKLLLFKTTNFICTDKFWGDYAVSAPNYEIQDRDTLEACYKYIHNLPLPDDYFLSKDSVERYCERGALEEHSVKDLNHRLLEFVDKYNKQSHQSNMTVAIYNDHDVESCEFTDDEDGRHYHPLNLMRIRLLAHVIQCLYPDN